jgi:hypothetical protein
MCLRHMDFTVVHALIAFHGKSRPILVLLPETSQKHIKVKSVRPKKILRGTLVDERHTVVTIPIYDWLSGIYFHDSRNPRTLSGHSSTNL